MQRHPELSICSDKTFPVPRQPDSEGFQICCIGGFRAGMVDDDCWAIDPAFDNGRPTGKGFLTKAQLYALLEKIRLMPIAFQRHGWLRSEYHSSWSPIIPGRKNHMQSPADLWSNIANNLAGNRSDAKLGDAVALTFEQICEIF